MLHQVSLQHNMHGTPEAHHVRLAEYMHSLVFCKNEMNENIGYLIIRVTSNTVSYLICTSVNWHLQILIYFLPIYWNQTAKHIQCNKNEGKKLT